VSRPDPRPTEPESNPPRPPGASATVCACAELFAISFLILFLELACIRWFGATVIFLTFFTNIVLMACFLGVSVGCLAAGRRGSHWIQWFIPLTALAVLSASGLLWGYQWFGELMIDVGGQQSPQLIYFGTDARRPDPSRFVVPIEVVAGVFFTLIALVFVGPGQELGRRFAAVENRVVAYSADILGSLAGIAVFAAMSRFWVPAWVWFLIALGLAWCFVRRPWRQLPLAVVVLAGVWAADWPRDLQGVKTEVVWSPYYQVRFKPRYGSIDVNNLGHQGMLPVGLAGPAYLLPHLLNRDAGGSPFAEVMIIGAGSGNDVAAALRMGANHIDAVEIDPVISHLGRLYHPDRPFDDRRCSIQLDDGRSQLRRAPRKYDLISYAVVDSLVLHSGYSSLRLESFLFTEEAFRDVQAALKPDGVFAMYNFYRQGWVVGRLVALAEKVFGTTPLVISLPYQDRITPDNDQRDYITFLLVGNRESRLVDTIRERFAADRFFWIHDQPRVNESLNGFGPSPPVPPLAPGSRFNRIAPAEVERTGAELTPTDEWPFLYLKSPTVPGLSLRGIALVGTISLLFLLAFAPVRRVRPDGRMFFLGAGFMLLETKGVVQMALLFGSTWVVNSIVFFSILLMILLSNLFVLAVRPKQLWPYFSLLLVALGANVLVPAGVFLELSGSVRVVASCALFYLPIFFAGVVFATAFRESRQPDVDFGSNIGGIILGGLSEYLSLVLGFRHLLWVAIGFYLLAAACGRGARRGTADPTASLLGSRAG